LLLLGLLWESPHCLHPVEAVLLLLLLCLLLLCLLWEIPQHLHPVVLLQHTPGRPVPAQV
jgi:hypothetical protein